MTRRKWGLLLSLLTASVLLPVAQGARGLAQTGGTGPAAAPAAAPAATATSAAAPPTAAPPAVAGKAADAALLLAFKDTFDNGAALLPSWQPGTDPCVWQGVACVNGAVTGIVSWRMRRPLPRQPAAAIACAGVPGHAVLHLKLPGRLPCAPRRRS